MTQYRKLEVEIMEDFLTLLNKKELESVILNPYVNNNILSIDAGDFFFKYFRTLQEDLQIKIFSIYPYLLHMLSERSNRLDIGLSVKVLNYFVERNTEYLRYVHHMPQSIANKLLLKKNIEKCDDSIHWLIYKRMVCSYNVIHETILKCLPFALISHNENDLDILSCIFKRDDINNSFLNSLLKICPQEYHYYIEQHPRYEGVAAMIIENIDQEYLTDE